MVLIPTEEEAGLNTTCLAEATMFKSGMYNNVLVPSHFVSCSKKAAYGAKRAMSESWKYDKSKLLQLESGTRFASSKVNRGQLGEGLRQEWMNDLVRVCNTKVMFICTIGSGPCEVDIAALNIKTSIAATNANVKVCTWSHDPRKNFAEVETARVKTALGEAHMAQTNALGRVYARARPGRKSRKVP